MLLDSVYVVLLVVEICLHKFLLIDFYTVFIEIN